jgi:hypothetical protein
VGGDETKLKVSTSEGTDNRIGPSCPSVLVKPFIRYLRGREEMKKERMMEGRGKDEFIHLLVHPKGYSVRYSLLRLAAPLLHALALPEALRSYPWLPKREFRFLTKLKTEQSKGGGGRENLRRWLT